MFEWPEILIFSAFVAREQRQNNAAVAVDVATDVLGGGGGIGGLLAQVDLRRFEFASSSRLLKSHHEAS